MRLLAYFALAATLCAGSAFAQSAAPAPSGAASFKAKCAVCHTVTPNTNGVGPSLFGVVGRQAAAVPGFPYSPAMKADKRKWDSAALDAFLKAPAKAMPGTRMLLPVAADAERKALIDYLATLK